MAEFQEACGMIRRVSVHEALFLVIGLFLGLQSAFAGLGLSWVVWGFLGVYGSILWFTAPGDKLRLLSAYGVAWALYAGSSVLVEKLGIPLRHRELLAADSFLHRPWTGTLPAWANDFFSAGYLSYHVYLHCACIDALLRGPSWRQSFSRRIFTAFGIGFIGYFTLPAASPAQAFPKLFPQAITGGLLTAWNDGLNAAMAARYDSFPSLHVLITLMLLGWDWRRFRGRFWIMLIPSVVMIAATVILRLHYTVDLLASGILFVGLHAFFERERT
jgi:hypothetical protein